MSLEKQAEGLLKAVTDLISCVTVMISGKPGAPLDVSDTAGEKTTKKEYTSASIACIFGDICFVTLELTRMASL